jgi:integrase
MMNIDKSAGALQEQPPAMAHEEGPLMSNTNRSRRTGIEDRRDAAGHMQYRGHAYDRRAKKKLRGEWTYNLAEAVSWRKQTLAALDAGAILAADGPTVRDAGLAWMDRAEAGEIVNRSGDPYKPSALRGYRRDLEQRIIPALGPSKLADVKLGDLQRLAERWRMEGMSASSIRNAFLPLRAIYRYHAAVDGLTANPTRGLQLPAVRGRRDRIASPKEAAALLAALPEGERAVWGTAFYGGLRRGELRALPWEDVNLARGVIHVRAGWDDLEGLVGTKSRAGERVVPINARLRDLLVEHGLQTRRSTGLVFGRDAELPFSPGTVSKRAAKAWKKAKLSGVTLHEARHTFASLMIAAGANAKQVQAYMGHASIAITYDLYGHLLPGDEAHAAALLDAYLDEHEE